LIEIRINGAVLLRTWDSNAEEIATLQIAVMRQFRRGHGFPVTFVGFQQSLDRMPAGHMTVWLHPSMPVIFDYGTACPPARIDEEKIAAATHAMENDELGFLIAKAQAAPAISVSRQ
jgi:hypothetical protein